MCFWQHAESGGVGLLLGNPLPQEPKLVPAHVTHLVWPIHVSVLVPRAAATGGWKLHEGLHEGRGTVGMDVRNE